MPSSRFELFVTQIQLHKTNKHGGRYTDDVKMMTLALYHLGGTHCCLN